MKIVANVENTVFRNADNGYSVLSLSYNKKRITAVGTLSEVFEGQTLELEGEFIVNKKFGEQFEIHEMKVVEPTTLPAIEKYLSSGLIFPKKVPLVSPSLPPRACLLIWEFSVSCLRSKMVYILSIRPQFGPYFSIFGSSS